jgi:hypothetical protein
MGASSGGKIEVSFCQDSRPNSSLSVTGVMVAFQLAKIGTLWH